MTPKQFTGRILLCALVAVTAAMPLAAAAQQARSAKWVNLRAGPDSDYPRVARLGANTPLAVQGCTEGFGWCDVIAPDGARGWLYGGNIVYPYQNAQVPVLSYGAVIGVPIVTFVIGSYWNDHYRHRPWYGNRWRWERRPSDLRPPLRRPGWRPTPGDDRPAPGVRRPESHRPPGAGGGGNRPGGGHHSGGDGRRPHPR